MEMKKFEYFVTECEIDIPFGISLTTEPSYRQRINALSVKGVLIKNLAISSIKRMDEVGQISQLKHYFKSLSKSCNRQELRLHCDKFFAEVNTNNVFQYSIEQSINSRMRLSFDVDIGHRKALSNMDINYITKFPKIASGFESIDGIELDEIYYQVIKLTEQQEKLLVTRYRKVLIKKVKDLFQKSLNYRNGTAQVEMYTRIRKLYNHIQVLNFIGWEF